MMPPVHKLIVACAVIALLAIIVIVFRLRNRGPRPEDSPEFRRQSLYATAGRAMVDAMSSAYPTTRPWSAFVTVRDQLRMRDQGPARAGLHRVVEASDSETVVRLIAWNMLRELGESPDAALAQKVLGVVVELPGSRGSQVVAVYEDGSVGYLDAAGDLTQLPAGGPALALARQQIEQAQQIAFGFQPLANESAPAGSAPRITLLTFAGMRSNEIAPDDTNSAFAALLDRAKEILAATSATSRSGRS